MFKKEKIVRIAKLLAQQWDKFSRAVGWVLTFISPVVFETPSIPDGQNMPYDFAPTICAIIGFGCALFLFSSGKITPKVKFTALALSGIFALAAILSYRGDLEWIASPTYIQYLLEFFKFCIFYALFYVFLGIVFISGGDYMADKLRNF
ncbi:hypothetical protein [Yoonia sp. SS1-5]|uniref:Uncharacterized protein n=1 Tax=Yoonia rhodophyticola TaxID=3137370 RepID=A0AAN0NJL2_9RHOB